jgi:predicted dinucleotide-binding enzyme
MNVTIIGGGKMGRGIGTRLVAGGNDAQVIDRDPAEAEGLAEELSAAASDGGSATGAGPDDELRGKTVFLAMYYPGVKDAVAQYGERLAGRVVVDITNPVDASTFDSPATPAETSAAEEIAELVPPGTPVVKAFNTTFAGTLRRGRGRRAAARRPDRGDDAEAKSKVATLAESAGTRAVDVGPLRRARQLESLGFLHTNMQEALGTGFGSTVKLHW